MEGVARCVFAVALVVISTVLFAEPLKAAVVDPGAVPKLERGTQFKQDELLVKFLQATTPSQARAAAQQAGAADAHRFRRPRGLEHAPIDAWYLVRLGPGAKLGKVRAALMKNPLVVRVEYNFEVRVTLTPNDPRYGELWGLHNIGQTGGTVDADIDAPEAWDLQAGSQDVLVAVIDTGVDYNHPDLQANIWTNPGEIPGNGIDDDGNGYVDDIHGYDFYNFDADPLDDHGHGTHVSGTIAGVGNNGIGVVGVSWKARIMGVKFLGASGSGSTSGAISAVLYAADMSARVMNNSWGGGGYSLALEDAIKTADAAGALFVAAAGNSSSNNDMAPHYPSSYDVPNVLAVAATDHSDALAYFSSYGAASVDLGAPGVNILSSVPFVGDPCCSDSSGYKLLNGTSMATPHVSGAAAVLFAQFPGATQEQTKLRLMGAVNPVPALNGITVTGGRLNLLNALETDTTPPAPVFDLSVPWTGGHSVQLSWTATGDDGNSGNAAAYDVRYAAVPIDASNWSTATQAVGEPTPSVPGATEVFKLGGLEPGSNYYFALQVLDNVGNASGPSNVVQASTQDVSAVFLDDMESGPVNWTVSGTDGIGGPALWHISPHRYNSPNNAFYYGREETLTYDTGARNAGEITSIPIDLAQSQDSELSFLHYLATEGLPPYDTARVQVSDDGGLTWQDVYATAIGTAGQMVQHTADLTAYDGKLIQLRFAFDTLDSVYNYFEGWVIDDVVVTGVTGGAPYPNQPPVANVEGPYSTFKTVAVNFSSDGSYDPEGATLTYSWDFGDGTTGTGPAPSHAYAASGIYTVTLVVNDGTADSTPATTTVTVSNRAPVALIGASQYYVAKNVAITFNGSYSTDPDGDALTYVWDFGDGTTASGPIVEHAYSAIGSYVTSLVVSDGESNSSPATVTIQVYNQAPVANAGADQTVRQRSLVTLDGTGSFDADGVITAYSWTQFSGEPVTLNGADTATPTFEAPKIKGPGTLQLTFSLIVTDDDGVSSFSDLVTVTVEKH